MTNANSNEVSNELNYWAKMEICHLPFAMQDLARFCLGDYIAAGMSRMVFDWKFTPNTVVKFCKAEDCQSNWNEYSVWQTVKDTKNAKWFCPVIDISPCGRFLLMEKARTITTEDKLPKKLPNFFTDIYTGNFGYIEDRFVCIDYQFISRSIDLSFCTQKQSVNWV